MPAFPDNTVVFTPKEYKDSVTKYYPTIIYFHGTGEAGTDVNKLTSNYLLGRIKSGWEPQATNPVTGKLEKFIVIAVQDAGGWSPYPAAMRYAWKYTVATAMKGLRVDTNRIYTTGLSSGGQTSVMYACWDSTFAGKIAAVVSLSPAALEAQAVQNLPMFAKYNTPVWFISGSTDGNTDYAKAYTTTINNAGGYAWTTVYPGGHGGWDAMYNGTTTRVVNGKTLNIYEWMLLNSRGPAPVAPVDTTTTPPVIPTKKLLITIKVYSDGTTENIPAQ
ncbi:hypothetical protein DCC81_11880 [Chitinophaga parva]|uniref:Phospholipase n=1 Tax=Chitinophaga parva TaxID=2169414 RepID=A0A2T7BFE2_9BACT|nr:hypothetical protein DCC81_11880 [Chitinophaga parva]